MEEYEEEQPRLFQHKARNRPRPLRLRPLYLKSHCHCGVKLVHADQIINPNKPQAVWDMDTWMCPSCRHTVLIDRLNAAPRPS